MPRKDGTGPMGLGKMTGKGFGVCPGANNAGFGFGRGRGFGMGMGSGFRCRANFAGQSPVTEKESLAEQKNFLQSRLNAISRQLEELSDDTK